MRIRLTKQRFFLTLIVVVAAVAAATLAVRTFHIGSFNRGSDDTPLGLRLGLDLQGGTSLIYQADDPNVTSDQMDGLVSVIERRINAFGVSEPVIQRKGENELLIQLPGIKDIDQAKQLIGGTAQLDFRQCTNPNATHQGNCSSWEPATGTGDGGVVKPLTGAFMRPTSVVLSNPTTGLPEVSFSFNSEGARIFSQITRRLIGRPLGIFLDSQLVSAPIVQSEISDTGRITGLTSDTARRLSIQLNAGALPVSIKVIREQDVSATLGKDSLHKSYIAAGVGLGLVMLFMVLYYKMLGLISAVALGLYTVVVLALFKLVPVTLTLSGIAAFVISIGIAVDANVLIFERMREELRAGRTLNAAIETGFDRAWSAIFDSHVALLMTMAILWWLGDQLGEPRVIGFAVTFIIAALTNLFTAMVVSKTLLRQTAGTRIARRLNWFADIRARETPARPALSL